MSSSGTIIEGIQVLAIASEPELSGPKLDNSATCLTLRGLFTGARVWGGPSNPLGRLLSADGIEQCGWVLDVPEDVQCSPEEPMDAYIFCGSKGPGLVLVEVQPLSAVYRRIGKIKSLPGDRDNFVVKTIRLR